MNVATLLLSLSLLASASPASSLVIGFELSEMGDGDAPVSGTLTNFAPSPSLIVFADAGATQIAFFAGGKFQLTAGTTYYLKDSESIPEGASYPGAHFYADSGSGNVEVPGSPTAGPGPIPWTPTAACTAGCSVRVNVGTASDSKGVVISAPPPSNQLRVSVQGPSTGSVATPLTFTAAVSGGTGPYSYAWNCQWSQFFGSGGFVAGAQTHACTFSSAGNYAVAVAVTDSAGTGIVSDGHAVKILVGRRSGLLR